MEQCNIIKNHCLNKEFWVCTVHKEEADNCMNCRKVTIKVEVTAKIDFANLKPKVSPGFGNLYGFRIGDTVTWDEKDSQWLILSENVNDIEIECVKSSPQNHTTVGERIYHPKINLCIAELAT